VTSEFNLEADYLHDLRIHPFGLLALDEIGQPVHSTSLIECYRRLPLELPLTLSGDRDICELILYPRFIKKKAHLHVC
jgi:hypothetical protein